jgi:hypothetical protein
MRENQGDHGVIGLPPRRVPALAPDLTSHQLPFRR